MTVVVDYIALDPDMSVGVRRHEFLSHGSLSVRLRELES